MARERMVTRTVNATTIQYLAMNIKSATPETLSVTTGETFENNDKALKWVKKHCTTEDVVPCAIIATAVSEILYGMPEADFIKLARVLPPRAAVKVEAE